MIVLKILIFAGFLLKITEVVTMTFDIELLKEGFLKAQKYIDTFYVSLFVALVLVMFRNSELPIILYCVFFMLVCLLFSYLLKMVVVLIIEKAAWKYVSKLNYHFLSYVCLILALYYVINKSEMLIMGERLKYHTTDIIYFFLHLFQ